MHIQRFTEGGRSWRVTPHAIATPWEAFSWLKLKMKPFFRKKDKLLGARNCAY